MAKKKGVNEDIENLRKIMKEKEVIFGTDRAMDMVRSGKAASVFVSSNCPEDVKADIEHYSSISGVKVTNLDITNEELGTMCRKPFSISILCEPKE